MFWKTLGYKKALKLEPMILRLITVRAHTHREAETERGRHRATDRRKMGDRHGREDGILSKTDTLAQTVTHLRERPCGRSSFPKGGGVSALVRPDGLSALGLAVTRGVPKTSSQPRSQRSPLAWLPKARRSPGSQARGCMWVCWWARVWLGRLGAGWIPRMEAAGCGGRELGSLCGPLAVSLYLFLSLPYLWFLVLDLSWWRGVSVCVCVCVCLYACEGLGVRVGLCFLFPFIR